MPQTGWPESLSVSTPWPEVPAGESTGRQEQPWDTALGTGPLHLGAEQAQQAPGPCSLWADPRGAARGSIPSLGQAKNFSLEPGTGQHQGRRSGAPDLPRPRAAAITTSACDRRVGAFSQCQIIEISVCFWLLNLLCMGLCIKHQLARSTKRFGVLFLLSGLSERIWMRSVSEHRTLNLNWWKDTKATSLLYSLLHIVHISLICFITNNYQLQAGWPAERAVWHSH